MELTTPRLFLRTYEEEDFPQLFRLQNDPDIMRHIRPPETEEAFRERIALWRNHAAANPGASLWVAQSLDRQQFAGYALLRHQNMQPDKDMEIGYTISKEHWGKGYATEIVLRLLVYVREVLNPPKVIAITDPHNLSSARVLEKCGFVCTGKVPHQDGESIRWEINFERN